MDVTNELRNRVAGAGRTLSRASAQERLNLLLFATAYLVAYAYGSLFSQTAPAPLWLPDSVLLCALLVTPRNRWWLYVAVALPLRFVPGLSEGVPKWFVFATYANDMLKGILAAYVLRRMFGGSVSLSTLREFAAYLLIAVLAAPVLSAFGGAVTRGALGDEFWTAWGQWFAGDALANLILTPTLLYWCTRRYGDTQSRLEIVLWIVGFSVSLYVTVALTGSHELPISMYVPIPFLIWAATRFGPIGASSALSLVTLVAMIGITERQGVFAEGDMAHGVLFLQLFLAVISVPVLFVAILIEERSFVEKRLRESQERLNENYARVRDLAGKLISAQEDERKRIALELHDDIGQRLALLAIGMACRPR
jgi:two-component system sensor histidine kinase UhpB